MELINYVIYVSIYLGLVATTFYILSFLYSKKEKLMFNDDELPKVSVIIPVYNEENSIATTLNSILTTDYPKGKFEIIVVNDGSKDNTEKIARRFEARGIKVISKKNGGKGSALNLGISKARGDIIFSMDADTLVKPDSVKTMVRYFKNKKVMSVSPAMILYKPKTILQRIQAIEYLVGLFLRKAFASVNSIYVTPGAFSAYRKTFFDKYGGYDEGNITEDLELALRIQSQDYIIENVPEATAYTIAPPNFVHLLKQRRRWYYGLMHNLWNYRKVISSEYGDMGLFVIPIAIIMIIFTIIVTVYEFIKAIFNARADLILLNNLNFDFKSVFSLNAYLLENIVFKFITNPIVIFLLIFVIVVSAYLSYASKKTGKISGLAINVPLFFIFFAILFGFWWIVSIIYYAFNKKISWK